MMITMLQAIGCVLELKVSSTLIHVDQDHCTTKFKKRVFPSLVYFQTIHIFLDCTLARVGPSPSDSTATITIEDNFKCPTEIDRSQPQENREDKFSVVQTGSSLTITQIGSGLSNWDLNLQFLCCGGKDTFQSFNF